MGEVVQLTEQVPKKERRMYERAALAAVNDNEVVDLLPKTDKFPPQAREVLLWLLGMPFLALVGLCLLLFA